ncbi:MAG: ribonuclease III [Lachnospiraceae bacterium]|jgi:ribonuclease-3|nr:ribonuclease III [Lachnospiraceae bacterium]
MKTTTAPESRRSDSVNILEAKIGYIFNDELLLLEAITHSSYTNEQTIYHMPSYERLEFLGDAILGAVIAEYLFKIYPEMAEGQLSTIRSRLVCEAALTIAGTELGLKQHIYLGRGEEQSGGRKRRSLAADVVEAIIGAIYIDGGYSAAEEFIHKFVLADMDEKIGTIDAKTLLQEYAAKNGIKKPEYRLTNVSGPDHAMIFVVELFFDGGKLSSGSGKSKKSAEQSAAYYALQELDNMKEKTHVPKVN